jgi:hypothetical protein
MDFPVSRRRFLQVGLGGAAVLALPLACGDEDEAAPALPAPGEGQGRWLPLAEYETLRALVDVVIPQDEDPGAVFAGVTDYIDFLLGAFTIDPPRIHAAGPFSGRLGGEANFGVYLPLSRVQEIAWRTTIEGSQGIAEREFNGPVVGWQELYLKGLAYLDALAVQERGLPFKDLPYDARKALSKKAEPAGFMDVVFDHVVEGMYAVPEYGGNWRGCGWKQIKYEGDRQPVGYNRRQVEERDPDEKEARVSDGDLAEAAALFERLVTERRWRWR